MNYLTLAWPALNVVASVIILFLLLFRCKGFDVRKDRVVKVAVLFGLYFAVYTFLRSLATLVHFKSAHQGVELIASAECSMTLLIFVPLLRTLSRRC